MPDFDTRRPQEPDRPNRMHMFVAASKQHMFGVAIRLLTPVQALLRNRKMSNRLGLALSVLSLVVLAGVLTVWAVRIHIASEQLGQEIKLPPTPAYQDYYEDSSLSPVSSGGTECDVSEIGHYEEYACHDVITKVTDPAELASITQELNAGQMGYADVMEVSFSRSELGDTQFTSYCFDSEFRAADALRRHPSYLPRLVGRTDDCYVIVYEGGLWHML